jgi:chromosome segregation ATPase
MKNNYDGFRGWLKYIRDYKDNKDNDLIYDHKLITKCEQIRKLQEEIAKKEFLAKEKDNLIELREKRIDALNNKISNYVKRNDELRSIIETQYKEINDLKEKIEEKELSRRKSAGSVGGLKAKINELDEQLIKANYTINFYKTHQKSPTIEELKAYEYSRKEVEKRQKNGIIQQ